MSKISDANSKAYATKKLNKERHTDEIVTNFMDGESYVCNPLTTLKLVTASSIYGEPAYYRDGGVGGRTAKAGIKKVRDAEYRVHRLVAPYTALPDDRWHGKKTSDIMESVIDEALSYDFGATLDWALTLRREYNMRLNPQVIMVRASIHPDRAKWTEQHPGRFDVINRQVMQRADDPLSQLSYYIYTQGNKNKMPSILKRSIAGKLSSLTRYQVAKYKNHELGMKNAAFITHAFSDVLDELIKTDNVELSDSDKTWENMRSAGADWKTIFNTVNMGHMALLRNLRGVFTEVEDYAFCTEYLSRLKNGVADGKQFPFRYWAAMEAIDSAPNVHHKPLIMDALEECMDIALSNVPHLHGKTMALSDNSGSAWGSFTSEYGSVTVAEIDNLSAAMISAVSDEGYVGIFGDRLRVVPVSKRNGLLRQVKEMYKEGRHIGGSTENGIWLFFRDAIDNEQWWDNIVVFSDQQAGHGGLYGTSSGCSEYTARGFNDGRNVNVMDLIMEYRRKVNPKVNVMTVQTAGYYNVVIPENIYRGTIAYGWTGQEAKLLKATADIWDAVEDEI